MTKRVSRHFLRPVTSWNKSLDVLRLTFRQVAALSRLKLILAWLNLENACLGEPAS